MRRIAILLTLLFISLGLLAAPARPASLSAAQDGSTETPPASTSGVELDLLVLDDAGEAATVWLGSFDLTRLERPGVSAAVVEPLPPGQVRGVVIPVDLIFVTYLRAGLLYFNAHSTMSPEIRGRTYPFEGADRQHLADLIREVRASLALPENAHSGERTPSGDAVPEPAPTLLLASGLAGFVLWRRRAG